MSRLTPRVTVLMGGWSAEREISLKTGKAVFRALREAGQSCEVIDLKTAAGLKGLLVKKPDLVFIALHGTYGEDGRIQGFLDMAGIPYTGSGMLASCLAMHKALAKELFVLHDVITPAWQVMRKGEKNELTLALPVVVKPSSQGSALGITIVEKKAQFMDALKKAFAYDSTVVVEKYIRGRELTVGILGSRPLPVIEILPKRRFYDFIAKYKKGMSLHLVPAPLTHKVTDAAQHLGLQACQVLGCRGASRVDMILDEQGRLNVLEVNTIPGMTETSLLPEAAQSAGLPFTKLVLTMVEIALQQASAAKARGARA